MRPMTILESDLPAFLATLAGAYRVYAPRRIGTSDVVFAEVQDGVPVDLRYTNTVVPPKALFFPAREALFHIQGTTRPTLSPPRAPSSSDGPLPEEADRPVAVFGLRSCDAVGLTFLERFFAGRQFEDDTIVTRLRSSLRMTLACHTPGPDCFCVCCEGGPWLTSGCDIQFSDIGGRLIADVLSARGEAAVAGAASLFAPATPDHLDARSRQVEQVDASFGRRSYVASAIKRISLDRVPQEKWEEWAEDCQNCGGCCVVCPTCSCFTVSDRPQGGTAPNEEAFVRERRWDACLYEGFTREASTHNPRAARAARLKRRFFHKLSYQYVELMGRHGCVGCGRCAATCMGGLDISTLLERIHDECL